MTDHIRPHLHQVLQVVNVYVVLEKGAEVWDGLKGQDPEEGVEIIGSYMSQIMLMTTVTVTLPQPAFNRFN